MPKCLDIHAQARPIFAHLQPGQWKILLLTQRFTFMFKLKNQIFFPGLVEPFLDAITVNYNDHAEIWQ